MSKNNSTNTDFKVGQLVYLTKDIFDGGGDFSPPGYVGRRGDLMKVTGIPSYSKNTLHIAHFDYAGEGGICAYLNEVSTRSPLITINERREYNKKYGMERGGFKPEDLRVIKLADDIYGGAA